MWTGMFRTRSAAGPRERCRRPWNVGYLALATHRGRDPPFPVGPGGPCGRGDPDLLGALRYGRLDGACDRRPSPAGRSVGSRGGGHQDPGSAGGIGVDGRRVRESGRYVGFENVDLPFRKSSLVRVDVRADGAVEAPGRRLTIQLRPASRAPAG